MKLTVKPTKNTKKFLNNARIYQGIMSRDATGVLHDLGEKRELGVYDKEKFHSSRQIIRGPIWSESKAQYNIGDISDEELNKLVQACDLYNAKGEKIMTANRRRFGDPFFDHPDLRVILEEGEGEFDPDNNPIHKVIHLGWLARTQFRSDRNGLVMSSRVKYDLTNDFSEVSNTNDEVDLWTEVGALFKTMDDDKMKKIAIILNIGVTENTTHSVIKSSLGRVLMGEEKYVKGTSETYKHAFVRLAKASTDEFNLHYFIAMAIKKAFLRKKKDQGWLFNGKPIANAESQIYHFFADPSNQDDLFELEKLVGDNSKVSTSKTRSSTKSTGE